MSTNENLNNSLNLKSHTTNKDGNQIDFLHNNLENIKNNTRLNNNILNNNKNNLYQNQSQSKSATSNMPGNSINSNNDDLNNINHSKTSLNINGNITPIQTSSINNDKVNGNVNLNSNNTSINDNRRFSATSNASFNGIGSSPVVSQLEKRHNSISEITNLNPNFNINTSNLNDPFNKFNNNARIMSPLGRTYTSNYSSPTSTLSPLSNTISPNSQPSSAGSSRVSSPLGKNVDISQNMNPNQNQNIRPNFNPNFNANFNANFKIRPNTNLNPNPNSVSNPNIRPNPVTNSIPNPNIIFNRPPPPQFMIINQNRPIPIPIQMPMQPTPNMQGAKILPPMNRPMNRPPNKIPIRPFVPNSDNLKISSFNRNSTDQNIMSSPLETGKVNSVNSPQMIRPINTNNLSPTSQDSVNSSKFSYSSTASPSISSTLMNNNEIQTPVKTNNDSSIKANSLLYTPNSQTNTSINSESSIKTDIPSLNIPNININNINKKFPPPFSSSPITNKGNMMSFVHSSVNSNQPNNNKVQLSKVPIERSQSCSPTPVYSSSPLNNSVNTVTPQINHQNRNSQLQSETGSISSLNTFTNIYTSAPIFKRDQIQTSQNSANVQTSNNSNNSTSINNNNNNLTVSNLSSIKNMNSHSEPNTPLIMNKTTNLMYPPNANINDGVPANDHLINKSNLGNMVYSNSSLFYRDNSVVSDDEGKSLIESKSMTLINDFKPIKRNTSNYIIPGEEDFTTVNGEKNENLPSGLFYCSPSAMPICETENLSFYSKNKLPKFTNLFNEKLNISQFDYHILPRPPKGTVIRSYNTTYSYISSSLNVVPYSKSMAKKLKIPFSILLSPYRNLHEGDAPIPVVNPENLATCSFCRAYINPFVTFMDDNSRYRCNICNQINPLPSFYKWSGKKGMKRPELVNPVVDYVFPMAPEDLTSSVYLFILDVSYISIQSGMVYSVAHTILNAMDKIPNPNDKVKVGFITVDSNVHFFKFDSKTECPSMMVLTDLEDVFLPSPDLFINLKEYRVAIEEFLKKLNKIFSFSYVNNNAFGSALKAGYEILKNIGGKMIAFQSILPDIGLGALKDRNPDEEKDTTLFQPLEKYYTQLAKDCVQDKICIDLFLFPHQFIDIATLASLSRDTGGSLYVYENFNSSMNGDVTKLENELTKVLSKSVGHNALAHINLSKGLSIIKAHGNITPLSSNRYVIPILNPENSYALELEVSDNIKDTMVSIQLILVHINDKGERKVRIITQTFPTSSNLTSIIENIDICTLCTFLAKKAVDNTYHNGPEYARHYIENTCIDIVKSLYNLFFSKDENKLLKIPTSLRLLPLFSLGLLNNEAFRNSKNVTPDMRSYLLSQIYSKSLSSVMNMIIPRFYSIHNFNSKVGQPIKDVKDSVTFPYSQNLCSDRIEGKGIYLIDNGLEIYLWISKNSDPELLQSLFGNNYDAIISGKVELPDTQNDYSEILHKLIKKIRSHHLLTHNCYPAIHIVKESSTKLLKRNFFANLIEDRHEYSPSYPQYLNNLLKELRE